MESTLLQGSERKYEWTEAEGKASRDLMGSSGVHMAVRADCLGPKWLYLYSLASIREPLAPTPHHRKHLGARQLSVAEVIPKGVDSRGPCGPSNWATILSWKEDLPLGPSYIWVHLLSQLSKGIPHGTQVAHLSVRHFPPCPYLVTAALSPPYDEGVVPLPGR